MQRIPTLIDRTPKGTGLIFSLPLNAELTLYDDYTTLLSIKIEFNALSPTEQRAYLNATLAEKLSQ